MVIMKVLNLDQALKHIKNKSTLQELYFFFFLLPSSPFLPSFLLQEPLESKLQLHCPLPKNIIQYIFPKDKAILNNHNTMTRSRQINIYIILLHKDSLIQSYLFSKNKIMATLKNGIKQQEGMPSRSFNILSPLLLSLSDADTCIISYPPSGQFCSIPSILAKSFPCHFKAEFSTVRYL